MIRRIRYFAITDEHDEVTGMGRIIQDETGLWSQLLEDGEWVENAATYQCLHDPLFGQEISKDQAIALAEKFGGSLE